MERFRNIQKGIITTLFGLGILVYAVHRYINTGDLDSAEILGLLAGFGLLFAKDQRSTHSK